MCLCNIYETHTHTCVSVSICVHIYICVCLQRPNWSLVLKIHKSIRHCTTYIYPIRLTKQCSFTARKRRNQYMQTEHFATPLKRNSDYYGFLYCHPVMRMI